MNIRRIKNAENLINLELNAMQKVIDLCPKVIEIIKKFEGKQANKRLDTALKQIDKNLFVIEIFYFNIFLLLFPVKYATDLFYHLILSIATKPVPL